MLQSVTSVIKYLGYNLTTEKLASLAEVVVLYTTLFVEDVRKAVYEGIGWLACSGLDSTCNTHRLVSVLCITKSALLQKLPQLLDRSRCGSGARRAPRASE